MSTPIYYTPEGSAYIRFRDVPLQLKQEFINFMYGQGSPIIEGLSPQDAVWLHDYTRFLKGRFAREND